MQKKKKLTSQIFKNNQIPSEINIRKITRTKTILFIMKTPIPLMAAKKKQKVLIQTYKWFKSLHQKSNYQKIKKDYLNKKKSNKKKKRKKKDKNLQNRKLKKKEEKNFKK